ncbi:MAG: EamA/RhaT family transporter, partial [Atopobiaceae bacterium]|nr:EamA/RhaT family transporter [Atopobiaceae bacterium]
MEKQERTPFLATTPGVVLGCLVCCALWGSAFPCIKIGYALFGVDAADTASQLLLAGVRFTAAGIMVIIGTSLARRTPMLPSRSD